MAKSVQGIAFEAVGEIAKVDEELGIVFGFAIICKDAGADYFDKQHDLIPEEAMLDAALDFMVESGRVDDMHDGVDHRRVVFALPLTTGIAKQLGIETPKTGLLIGMKPSPEVFEKYRSGERRHFSIGGACLEAEDA